jgi:hypothetical protein
MSLAFEGFRLLSFKPGLASIPLQALPMLFCAKHRKLELKSQKSFLFSV